MSGNLNLDAAIALVRAGMWVFPAQGGPDLTEAKRPHRALGSWPNAAKTNEDVVRDWFTTWPEALPAIACRPSRVVAIDADRHDGGADGVEAWKTLVAAHGGIDAPVVRTAGGGFHIYFRRPADMNPSDLRGSLPPGIDCKSAGYVVGVGARLSDGRTYELVSGALDSIKLLPDWLRSILEGQRPAVSGVQADARPPLAPPAILPAPAASHAAPDVPAARRDAYVQRVLDEELPRLRGAAKGERNSTLNVVAGCPSAHSSLHEKDTLDRRNRTMEAFPRCNKPYSERITFTRGTL